jgi:hypothetical protein
VVAWLRGDPEALRLAAEVGGLLGAQGVRLHVPRSLAPVRADVVVEPVPGSPEWAAYSSLPVEARYRVSHPDPLTALSLAITAPRRGFARLLLGVDPGRLCAASIVGDGVIIRAAKMPCPQLGAYARSAASRIPHEVFEAIVGSGPGFADAVLALEGAGVPYRLADESWTTSRPVLGPARTLRDRDLAAAATIALTSTLHP